MTADHSVEGVLRFWFGECDEHGIASAKCSSRWWRSSAAFDDEIRERFGSLIVEFRSSSQTDSLSTSRGRLAYIIVLDQFTRNVYRDSAEMYCGDAQSLAAALEGIDVGCAEDLGVDETAFLYMPLMHAEDLATQERCVALFERLRDRVPAAARKNAQGNLRAAVQHLDIIKRFGRFPHRNALLGRDSTAEEQAFLAQPGSSF